MEQLILRQWRDSDLEPYAAMNADPEVMRYFPAPLTKVETAASLERLRRGIEERGWGLWAVEVDGVFAGFTGLNVPQFSASFTPCVEMGWRFRREFWGRSLAYRAAREALGFGFQALELPEIVAFTAASNTRSRRLMERLGLARDASGDFDHPSIPDGHELRPHVLYRIRPDAVAAGERAADSIFHRAAAAFWFFKRQRSVRILPYFEKPAEFLAYEPRFAEIALLLSGMIQMNEPELQVEHVGSTSAPGCGGKGIIDLAVLYPEGCLARARALLDDLGFQKQGGPDPFPESRPMRVGSVEHEGRRIRIHAHVIARSSDEPGELLWFRDALRQDSELRHRYEERKRAILVMGIADPIEYCEAKGGFITEALKHRKPAARRVLEARPAHRNSDQK